MTTNNNSQCFAQKHDVQPVVYATTPRLSMVQRIIVLCIAVCFLWGAVPSAMLSQARKSELPPSILAGIDSRGKSIVSFGQLKKEFNKGFDLDSLRRFKQFLREREKEENTRRQRDKQPPVFSGLDMEFGVPIALKGNDKLDMKKNGTWETLPNGDKVWRLVVSSPNAVNLSFVFEEFDLPVGSKLYVYSTENAGRRDPAQYYTSEHCGIRKGKTKQFAIAPLSGSTMIFEYYEPQSVAQNKNKPTATIIFETITFGYERIGTFNEVTQSNSVKGKTATTNWNGNYSGTCGAPCGPGATDALSCMAGTDPLSGLNNDMQLLKKSAVQIIKPSTGSAFSATLINNNGPFVWDRGRYRPENYVLTVSHGYAMTGVETAVFRYNYENIPGAGTSDAVEDYYGCDLLTQGQGDVINDFALVRAYGAPLDAWYAGWTTEYHEGDLIRGLSFPWADRMKVRRGTIVQDIPDYQFFIENTFGRTWNLSSGGGNYNTDGNLVGTNYGNLYAGGMICLYPKISDGTRLDIINPFRLAWNHVYGIRGYLAPGSSSTTGMLGGAQYPPCHSFPFGCWGGSADSNIQSKLLIGDVDTVPSRPSIQIRIYPNPVADNLHAEIQSTGINRYAVQIFNSAQNVVKEVFEGNVSAALDFHVNVQDLPSGSYYLIAIGQSTNNKTLSVVKQFVIAK